MAEMGETRETLAFGASVAGVPEDSERREGKRYVRRLPCFVRHRWASQDGVIGAIVWDLSLTGIGLLLHKQLPVGTVLEARPMGGKGLGTLAAQVVRVERHEEGWLHGCELAEGLRKEELREWID